MAARLYFPFGEKPSVQKACGMLAKSVTKPFGTVIATRVLPIT